MSSHDPTSELERSKLQEVLESRDPRGDLVERLETTTLSGRSPCALARDIRLLRDEVFRCDQRVKSGQASRLPGNVAFLADNRILCRERGRGDSRYPYGQDGFNFWVRASGQMHANRGLFFLFLPPQEGREPSIAFFAGCRPNGPSEFTPHSMLPVPWIGPSESRIKDRYTVLGHDAAYFVTETLELITAVRVFLDSSRPDLPRICVSLYLENLLDRPLETYASSYWNPFCRHSFVEINEDRWFKRMSMGAIPRSDSSDSLEGSVSDEGLVLPPFILKTHEDVGRFQAFSNIGELHRMVRMTNQVTGRHLDLAAYQVGGDGKNGSRSDGDQWESNGNGEVLVTAGQLVFQQCTSRLGYVGSPRRDLSSAPFLTTGRLHQDVPVTVFNDIAIAGDVLRFVLPTDAIARMDYVFSVDESVAAGCSDGNNTIGNNTIDFLEVDRCLERVQGRAGEAGKLAMSMRYDRSTPTDRPPAPDVDTFNHFLPFLKKQVAICAMLTGYVNPAANSLIGIRDIFQAIEGHLLDRPAESRKKILEALDYVLVDGRCPRQYSLPANGSPGRMDLREYIDQGAWVISAIHTYLAVTGDGELLDQVAGYHQVSPQDTGAAIPADEKNTVFEHLIRILTYLDAHRDPETGLVLAMYGDWNDALDGLGVPIDSHALFGTGVSVMASLQLYQNCAEMIELLDRFAPDKCPGVLSRVRRLRGELREGLIRHAVAHHGPQRRLLHGWGDRRSYLVGSFSDSDGKARDGLTSNAFWVLSGMLDEDPSLREDILAAMERLDSQYGLKTFQPGFESDVPGVGRIVNVPIGTAENGAVYIHATTFAIAALFRMGEPQRAWEQLRKILPFQSHFSDPSHSPFVMPNSYLDSAELNLTGQSMDDWQTGSSNVLLKLLVRYVFGFHPTLDHLRIEPARSYPYDTFHLQAEVHRRRIRIDYGRAAVTRREIRLNGQSWKQILPCGIRALEGARIPYEALRSDGVNEIVVTDPVEA